tara:strand:- start:361 stop:792 length:432 start_codon:yes stop_codon:yes gene_type:complete
METKVKNQVVQFMVILVTYLVIDIGYQMSIGLKLMDTIYEQAGIREVMSEQPNHAWTILIFFLMIAFVLLKLAVEPAIAKVQYLTAVKNGALIGIAAYGTTALVFLWTITGFPFVAIAGFLVEGIAFCSISSGITAYLALQKK